MNSTRCSGWWEQMGIGRQEMDGLTVSIKEDTISGGGYDIVGMFTLEGTLTNGTEVDMIKHYLDKHTVLYKGEYDGSNLMKGTWVMSYGNGPWEIKFRNGQADTEKLRANKEEVGKIELKSPF